MVLAVTWWGPDETVIDVGAPAAPPAPELALQIVEPQRRAVLTEDDMRVSYIISQSRAAVNVLAERMMAMYQEVYGRRAGLTGTNKGRAYEHPREAVHRLGCAIDLEVAWGMSVSVQIEKAQELADRMFHEIDPRARVVLYPNHHLHLAIRCNVHYYKQRVADSGVAWEAFLWDTRFDVKQHPLHGG